MDSILSAVAQQPALFPAAALIAGGVAAYSIGHAIVRIVEWGGKVTSLLGNHLRHDLGDVRDELSSVKTELSHLRHSTDEQTEVLRQISATLSRTTKELARV